jgi:plasmid stability protein
MHMTMIQIRNVPDDVHRLLKSRAAEAGMTLSDYLKREIEELAAQPTLAEVLERIKSHGSVDLGAPAADLVRGDREGREGALIESVDRP